MAASRAHTRALLAHLRGDAELASVVFDGVVPGKAPARYVLVFPWRPTAEEARRMSAPDMRRRRRYTVHCIGQIPAEAEWLADRVSARLTPGIPSVRLVVDGVVQGPIRHESGDPVRLDSSTPPAVYFFADDYAWEAQP